MLLLIEGYAYNSEFLTRENLVLNWLIEATRDMEMEIMSGPHVESVSFGPGQGVSGVIIIKESHLAIHTWPEVPWVEVHISSCRDFDAHRAIALLSRRADMPDPKPIIFGGGIENGKVTRLHLIEWTI